jgi:hypothetical protein
MLTIGVFGEAKQASELVDLLTDAIALKRCGASVAAQQPSDLNFLMGSHTQTLDSPNQRGQLISAGLPFHVLYGLPSECVTQAIGLIDWRLEKDDVTAGKPMLAGKPWVWLCEKCSDPVCEHRLLSDLIAARVQA